MAEGRTGGQIGGMTPSGFSPTSSTVNGTHLLAGLWFHDA
jgi:hypothetical protein